MGSLRLDISVVYSSPRVFSLLRRQEDLFGAGISTETRNFIVWAEIQSQLKTLFILFLVKLNIILDIGFEVGERILQHYQSVIVITLEYLKQIWRFGRPFIVQLVQSLFLAFFKFLEAFNSSIFVAKSSKVFKLSKLESKS